MDWNLVGLLLLQYPGAPNGLGCFLSLIWLFLGPGPLLLMLWSRVSYAFNHKGSKWFWDDDVGLRAVGALIVTLVGVIWALLSGRSD